MEKRLLKITKKFIYLKDDDGYIIILPIDKTAIEIMKNDDTSYFMRFSYNDKYIDIVLYKDGVKKIIKKIDNNCDCEDLL